MDHEHLLTNIRNHMDDRCDRIEDKLDGHLERITRVEEKQKSTQGHVKVVFSLVISGISAGVAWILKNIFHIGG